MNAMKLIFEQMDFDSTKTYIEEAVGTPGKKNYYIKGIFLQTERNRNNRVYPKHILSREVDRYTKEYINEKRAFGELGHPENPDINLHLVSHMITGLKDDGPNYYGEALIMDTPRGQIVKSFIDVGAKLGVSSRALGSVRESQGVDVVQEDLYLKTAGDIVADPSAPKAFVNGIMEGREWVWQNGVIVESVISSYKQAIATAVKRDLKETEISVFTDFLKRLGSKS